MGYVGEGCTLPGQAGLWRGPERRWPKPPGLRQPGAQEASHGARLAGTQHPPGGSQPILPSPAVDHWCRTSTDGRLRKLLGGEARRARRRMLAPPETIVPTSGLPTMRLQIDCPAARAIQRPEQHTSCSNLLFSLREVTHSVTVKRLQQWARGSALSPAEVLRRAEVRRELGE